MKAGRVLAVDPGARRYGLSMSDPTGAIARPIGVVEGEPALLDELRRLIHEEDVRLIVLGLPLNKDGTLGPSAKEAIALKARLEAALAKPVETWDERFTTSQAEGFLRQAGLNARRRAEKVDAVAAQILLQSFLDRSRAAEAEEAGERG
ncbi:MAG TPA: Holliday junction resolvase RuvX [Planctomycetota bacterium]|nr:Holliday junction resolvase RuvX [Planctomycetota bacterium]